MHWHKLFLSFFSTLFHRTFSWVIHISASPSYRLLHTLATWCDMRVHGTHIITADHTQPLRSTTNWKSISKTYRLHKSPNPNVHIITLDDEQRHEEPVGTAAATHQPKANVCCTTCYAYTYHRENTEQSVSMSGRRAEKEYDSDYEPALQCAKIQLKMLCMTLLDAQMKPLRFDAIFFHSIPLLPLPISLSPSQFFHSFSPSR